MNQEKDTGKNKIGRVLVGGGIASVAAIEFARIANAQTGAGTSSGCGGAGPGCDSSSGGAGCAQGGTGGGTTSGGGGGQSGGGTGGGGGNSTPFLRVWDGEKFVYENDILYAKPSNYFSSVAESKKAYEDGKTGDDIYKINTPFVAKNGKLAFQIREIEPEESFIRSLSFSQVAHPLGTELFVDSTLKKLWAFSREEVLKNAGVYDIRIRTSEGKNISKAVNNFSFLREEVSTPSNAVLEKGDWLTIKARVLNPKEPLFLLMGSYYRDWMIGHLDKMEGPGAKAVSYLMTYRSLSFLTFALMTVLVVFGGVSQMFSRRSAPEASLGGIERFAKIFEVPKAYADVPPPNPGGGTTGGKNNSLIVSYIKDGAEHYIDVVLPRFAKENVEAVAIPKEAYENGEVMLSVRATKKHNVSHLSFISPTKHMKPVISPLQMTKAYLHRDGTDYARQLSSKKNAGYLHTIPGDTVDLEFALPKEKNNQVSSYIVNASGFYAPASEETKRGLGNWVARLSQEEQEMLAELQPLQESTM